MPLYRNPKARVRPMMLPMIALAIFIGSVYVFMDNQRFNTPSFTAQREIASLTVWGFMFLFGALVMVIAMATRRLKLMQYSLFTGGVIYLWWGLLFLTSVIQDPHANPNGFALYAFIAFFHFLGAAPYLLDRLLYGKAQNEAPDS